MIGYSLSGCVADICRGHRKLDDVEMIVAGTNAVTEEDWSNLLDMYCRFGWKAFPEKAREVVSQLRQSGRIVQPRVNGEEAHSVALGRWDDEIIAQARRRYEVADEKEMEIQDILSCIPPDLRERFHFDE